MTPGIIWNDLILPVIDDITKKIKALIIILNLSKSDNNCDKKMKKIPLYIYRYTIYRNFIDNISPVIVKFD